MGLRTLKHRYGASNGHDQEAANELQRRGLNSKQLGEVLWEHGQETWREAKSGANWIANRRKAKVRSDKNKRKDLRRQERRRQEQIDRVARVKQGFRIVGENFDPSACDGSCPF